MLHPKVAEVLRITGLELLFDIHTSESEAAAAFLTKEATWLDEVREARQLSLTDGMRRPVSGGDAVYAPKLSTCSRHR
jgi:hypothetical protein